MATQTKKGFPYTNEQLDAIGRHSEMQRQLEPHAKAAAYNPATKTLCIELGNGATFIIPSGQFRGLDEATEEQLARVRVVDGRALFWDTLDVQMSLIAVLSDVTGLHTVAANARRAGSVRTTAKAAAVRVNGQKGGRPKKVAA